MRATQAIVTALLVCGAAFPALSADVVGKWNGKVVMEGLDTSNPQIKAQMKNVPTVSLTLKANKTYTSTQTGGMGTVTSEGTWVQSGSKVTLTPTKRDGKAVSGEGAKPRAYTLSADGKSMTLDLTSQVRSASANQKDPNAKATMAKMKVRVVLKKA